MRFTRFTFKNFKGIENQTLDLSKNPDGKTYTLVGLNESGKTTVLEAINYFIFKSETLDALELDSYKIEDIHNLIPINKRDNFNGVVVIEAAIELSEEDIDIIRDKFLFKDIKLTSYSTNIVYTQKYFFENSKHLPDKDKSIWKHEFMGKVGSQRKERVLTNEHALVANSYIIETLPSILYFPNFLFEFPERIYLNSTIEDKKHQFYQKIIQDILDSLLNDTTVQAHIIDRINSTDDNEKRNLNSLIGKMERQLTSVIFTSWKQILNKSISNTEIKIIPGNDEKGVYLEFNIKDDVDTYRIIERSLGFRWFFVYILLTQFRSYRKSQKEAFFLFDEPAFNLHPSAQMQLLKSFEKLPRVLYSTHSHYLINPKWLENTFVIKNEALKYDEEELYDPKKTDIKIFKYRNFSSRFPSDTSYFQPILDILDYKPSNLDYIPNSILCEGKNDFYFFNFFYKKCYGEESTLNFIPCTSSSNMDSLISLFLGWGRKFYILLDSDKEGNKQKERYLKEHGPILSNLIFTYSDISSTWINYEAENLLNKEDKLLIQKKKYPDVNKYNKSILNRSIQELLIKNEEVEVSEESLEKFRKVFDFLKEQLIKGY